jgi:hypothetical protein
VCHSHQFLLHAACREALEAVAGSVAAWLVEQKMVTERASRLSSEYQDRMQERAESFAKALTSASGVTLTAQDGTDMSATLARLAVDTMDSVTKSEKQQAEEAANRCLLAIGKHIEGSREPSWTEELAPAPVLWSFVAQLQAGDDELDGEQLASLWNRLQQFQPEGMDRAARHFACHVVTSRSLCASHIHGDQTNQGIPV